MCTLKINSFLPSLFIFIFVIIFNNYAQSEKDIVAKAGNISITKEEFKKRFEFTPHPGGASLDTTFAKKEFLHTLIAEKLLTQEALKEGLGSNQEYLDSYNYIRNFYLRDALYSKEVKEKTVIPDSEIVKGKKRIGIKLTTKFIFSQDEKEITIIYNKLMKGASFDSILSTRPEIKEQKNAEEVTFGKLNEKMEDALFSLKQGQFTKPIELNEGWYICKVYSGTITNDISDVDLKKIERVVQDRYYDRAYNAFYKKFFKGVVIKTDQRLFTSLYRTLYKYVTENEKSFVKKNGKYTLLEKEISSIKKAFTQNELQSVYVKFPKDPISMNQFFVFMSNEGFDFVKQDSISIKARLNKYTGTYIQNEILAREGLRRGYEKLPDVENDLKIWREYLLSNLIMKEKYKEELVTDEEAYNFFAKNNKIVPRPAKFKISEIIVDSLETVERIFGELKKGKNFEELARHYSIGDSTKSNNGQIDSDKIDKNDKIWKTASNMKAGEVYGPIKINGGYAIIKMLILEEQKHEQVETFEDAKSDIKNILQSEKMMNKLNDFTAKLALDNKLEINEKALRAIKINMIDMIVFRRFGFGGQQIAVPYVPNFSQWYKNYLKMRESLSF